MKRKDFILLCYSDLDQTRQNEYNEYNFLTCAPRRKTSQDLFKIMKLGESSLFVNNSVKVILDFNSNPI